MTLQTPVRSSRADSDAPIRRRGLLAAAVAFGAAMVARLSEATLQATSGGGDRRAGGCGDRSRCRRPVCARYRRSNSARSRPATADRLPTFERAQKSSLRLGLVPLVEQVDVSMRAVRPGEIRIELQRALGGGGLGHAFPRPDGRGKRASRRCALHARNVPAAPGRRPFPSGESSTPLRVRAKRRWRDRPRPCRRHPGVQ